MLLALAGAGDAAARRFQLSGTWAMRNGQVFVPLHFASNAIGPGHYHTSLGYLSMALGFPNGPVPGLGGATATGSDPATLVVPPGRSQGSFGTALPLGSVTLVQITTMFGVTSTEAGPTFYLPPVLTTPMGFQAASSRSTPASRRRRGR
jgi:hypothetical protein